MQAMLVASSLAILSLLLPPFSIVSSGTVALVTLRRGASEGFWVLLCAAVASALLGIILFNNYYFALLYGLVLWLPIWLIAVVLREGRQLSLALESAVLLGIVVILGFYLFHGNPSQIWQGLFEKMSQPLIQQSPEIHLARVQQSIALFAKIMTGIVVTGTIYSMLFGLFLGRWWQSLLFNPGGFRAEYLSLRVSKSLALASIIAIAIAFSGFGIYAEIAANIWVLLFVLYAIIGAAVSHALLDGLKNQTFKRFAIPMLYLTLTLIPQTMILIALLGLVDIWLDLRNKQSNRTSV